MTTTIATGRCTTCADHTGTRLSRHNVSTGWVTYYRCNSCRGVSAVHTPRITWLG
jgi:predicted SprT family Zn-dependent metalloprotease